MKDAVQFDGYPPNFFPYKAMLRRDVFLHKLWYIIIIITAVMRF